MSPKEAPMISVLEDIQNRLDVAALLLNPTNQEARMGWTGYTCSVANTQEGLDSPRYRVGRGVPVNLACSLRTRYTSEFCGNSFVGAYKQPLARRAAACRVAALAAAPGI